MPLLACTEGPLSGMPGRPAAGVGMDTGEGTGSCVFAPGLSPLVQSVVAAGFLLTRQGGDEVQRRQQACE